MNCCIEGCINKAKFNKLCNAHYLRLKRNGNPYGVRTMVGEKGRWLLNNVNYREDSCLIFPYPNAKLKVFGTNIYDWPARSMCALKYGYSDNKNNVVRHLCGNGHLLCVNPNHLTWGTNSENQMDRVIHNTSNRGERNGKSKLSTEDVLFIKKFISQKGFDVEIVKHLSKLFSVSRAAIYDIQKGRRWSWL